MRTTRVFQYENSQAVNIRDELAYDCLDINLEIERVGDELRVRPACKSLEGVLKTFANLSPDFTANERGQHEQVDRENS